MADHQGRTETVCRVGNSATGGSDPNLVIAALLHDAVGANQINSADDAYSFVAHMRLSTHNKPHWQAARQALNHPGASDAGEIQAWRTFRAAVAAEGWLAE